jgi:hypothetical protein
MPASDVELTTYLEIKLATMPLRPDLLPMFLLPKL